MQSIKQLTQVVASLVDKDNYLFSLTDLRGALLNPSFKAFKAVVSRAEKAGVFRRVCKGLYLYPGVNYEKGLVLYHAAARLRADEFNYISLESALSETGVISQIPMNWVTLMSSGRSYRVNCGDFGTIEFIHTKKRPADLFDQLSYDARCHLWRASVPLAIKDMKAAKKSLDLIDWSAVNEFV